MFELELPARMSLDLTYERGIHTVSVATRSSSDSKIRSGCSIVDSGINTPSEWLSRRRIALYWSSV